MLQSKCVKQNIFRQNAVCFKQIQFLRNVGWIWTVFVNFYLSLPFHLTLQRIRSYILVHFKLSLPWIKAIIAFTVQTVCIFFQNMFYLFFKLLTKTFSQRYSQWNTRESERVSEWVKKKNLIDFIHEM